MPELLAKNRSTNVVLRNVIYMVVLKVIDNAFIKGCASAAVTTLIPNRISATDRRATLILLPNTNNLMLLHYIIDRKLTIHLTKCNRNTEKMFKFHSFCCLAQSPYRSLPRPEHATWSVRLLPCGTLFDANTSRRMIYQELQYELMVVEPKQVRLASSV